MKTLSKSNHISEFMKVLGQTLDDTIILVKNIFGMTNVNPSELTEKNTYNN